MFDRLILTSEDNKERKTRQSKFFYLNSLKYFLEGYCCNFQINKQICYDVLKCQTIISSKNYKFFATFVTINNCLNNIKAKKIKILKW